jgi:hypothetical protein
MKLYRFSPIKNKGQLIKAIEYTHFTAFKLCKKALGKYLPTAGNIAIFCHYREEFAFLEKLGEELMNHNINFNGKYFRLYEPIVIASKNGVPKTTYEYLYIRQADRFRPQVGDADFVMDENEYQKIQKLETINRVEIFNRPSLSSCELFNPDFDVLIYLTTKTVNEALANLV